MKLRSWRRMKMIKIWKSKKRKSRDSLRKYCEREVFKPNICSHIARSTLFVIMMNIQKYTYFELVSFLIFTLEKFCIFNVDVWESWETFFCFDFGNSINSKRPQILSKLRRKFGNEKWRFYNFLQVLTVKTWQWITNRIDTKRKFKKNKRNLFLYV